MKKQYKSYRYKISNFSPKKGGRDDYESVKITGVSGLRDLVTVTVGITTNEVNYILRF